MISALDQTASVTRCIALGADDYLTKPFDPLVLRARVNSCLRKKWARDFELAYLRGVGKVTAAALAVEAGSFTPESLDDVGERSDPLGNLARLFQRMGVEVAARERRLRDQVEQLVIAIDEERKAAQVAEITESDYFQKLKARAKALAARKAARTVRSEADSTSLVGTASMAKIRLHSFVSRRDRQVERDRQPGRVPRVLWKESGGRRHRHPVARDSYALRARRYEPLANPQRLLVGALPGPGGGDGRDALFRSRGGRARLAGSFERAGRRDREGAARRLRCRPDERRRAGPGRSPRARLPADRHPSGPERGDVAVDRDLGCPDGVAATRSPGLSGDGRHRGGRAQARGERTGAGAQQGAPQRGGRWLCR